MKELMMEAVISAPQTCSDLRSELMTPQDVTPSRQQVPAAEDLFTQTPTTNHQNTNPDVIIRRRI